MRQILFAAGIGLVATILVSFSPKPQRRVDIFEVEQKQRDMERFSEQVRASDLQALSH